MGLYCWCLPFSLLCFSLCCLCCVCGLFYGCCVVWVLVALDAVMLVCFDLAASGAYVC